MHKIRKLSNHVQYPPFEEIYIYNIEVGRRTSKKIGNQILFYEAALKLLSKIYEGLIKTNIEIKV